MEKDSTEKVTNWSSAQDNFSFLCLTLFAFGFQEIVPNFPYRNRIFRPLKSVQQKWWSKAWRFSHEWKMLCDALATILAFLNSTQGYSTFGSDLTLLASFLVWFRGFTRRFSAIDSNHVEGSLQEIRPRHLLCPPPRFVCCFEVCKIGKICCNINYIYISHSNTNVNKQLTMVP